jgi:hypothetical protein
VKKLGKWGVVYVAVDGALSIAILAWFFSPWWPL